VYKRQALTIAVGEAVNNTIEHAYPAAGGTVHVQGAVDAEAVRVSIVDTGAWRLPHTSGGGGHGLTLIRQLGDTVEIRQTSAGTTVTIAMRLSRRDPAQAATTPAPVAQPAARPAASLRNETAPSSRPGGPAQSERDSVAAGEGVVAAQSTADARRGPGGARLLHSDGLLIVETFGDLDATCVDAVGRTFAEAAREDVGMVVVSLEHVGYIDSLTIRELFALGRDLMTRRRSLALIVPTGSALARIVEIAGLTREFPVYASMADAREAFQAIRHYG